MMFWNMYKKINCKIIGFLKKESFLTNYFLIVVTHNLFLIIFHFIKQNLILYLKIRQISLGIISIICNNSLEIDRHIAVD